jgi:hypothetical protein
MEVFPQQFSITGLDGSEYLASSPWGCSLDRGLVGSMHKSKVRRFDIRGKK